MIRLPLISCSFSVSDIRKGKITAKFRSLKRVLIAAIKGFMSPEKFRDVRETGPCGQSRKRLNLNKFTFFPNTVKRIGCFKDTARRAIPGVDGRGPLLTGYYRRRSDALNKCPFYASMKGFKVFGVQHQGWFATGPRAHVTYRKYGPSNKCRNGKGGPWANDVYRVYGKIFFPFGLVAILHEARIFYLIYLIKFQIYKKRSI